MREQEVTLITRTRQLDERAALHLYHTPCCDHSMIFIADGERDRCVCGRIFIFDLVTEPEREDDEKPADR
jgi:hypothetical protein